MDEQRGSLAFVRWALIVLGAIAVVVLISHELARPQVLSLTIDAPGYLMPSISALSGQGFGHTYGRGFVYPLVVYGSILGSGDLSGIIRIQIALYWLMLVTLVALMWIRVNLTPLNRQSISAIVAPTSMSAAVVILYLSYSPTLIAAYSLGPELLYGFLALTSSIALIWAFAQRERAGLLFVAAMCVSIFAAMANVLVKPQWIFGAAFILLVWLSVLAVSRMRLGSKVAVLLSMIAVTVAALALPERHLIEKHDPTATLFGPKTLFCNHADIIVRAARSRPGLWADFPSDFVLPVLRNLEAVAAEPHGWPLLGFNGDRCMYGNTFTSLVNEFHAHDIPRIRAFYTTMFINSILTEPLLYLRKVAAQMAFASLRPYWNAGLVVDATDSVALGLISAHKEHARLFAVPMKGSIIGTMAQHLPRIDRLMVQLKARLIGPLAIIAIVAGLVCWWVAKAKGLPISATPAFAIIVLTGAWLGQAFTVAASHTFDIGRYFWAAALLSWVRRFYHCP
jgi:hypothetical protein